MWMLDDYAAAKLDLATWGAMSDTQAHLVIGFLLYCIVVIATGRPFRALAVLAAAEGLNEWLDRLHYGSWRWENTRSDLIATMFWPSVLALLLWLMQRMVTTTDGAQHAGA